MNTKYLGTPRIPTFGKQPWARRQNCSFWVPSLPLGDSCVPGSTPPRLPRTETLASATPLMAVLEVPPCTPGPTSIRVPAPAVWKPPQKPYVRLKKHFPNLSFL